MYAKARDLEQISMSSGRPVGCTLRSGWAR